MPSRPNGAGGARRRRAALLAGLVTLLSIALPNAGAAAPSRAYRGRELADVLRELQEKGLPLVFTSELVRPGMTVPAEPSAREPRRVLEEVLAPHGLAVQEGPDGVLVVVPVDTPAPNHPAESLDEERAYVHDEIVVRPSRLSILFEKPESPLSITRDELESLPHLGGDAFRVLSLFPGTTANDVTAAFSVHGGRRDEVRVVLDGQELYDAYHLQDYDSALSIVADRSLAGASLLTGAFPASHGDRMSGVLELASVEPAPGRHFAVGVSALDALAQSSGTFAGDRGGWLLTARRGSLDLAADAIGDEHPAFWDVLGKAEIETGLGRFSLHTLAAADELELLQRDEEDLEQLENDYRQAYGWLTHEMALGDRALVATTASWADVRRHRTSLTREEEGSFALEDRRDLDVFGLAQAWDLQLDPRHLLRWGWEARRYDATFDYAKDLDRELVVIAPFSPPTDPVHAFRGTVTGDHLGLWLSDRRALFDRLTVELGLRYDRHPRTDDTLASPRVNLAWRLDGRSVVRAAWGRFFQSQRPYELQVQDAETGFYPAELSEHWVLGYEALPPPNALGLEAVRVELFRREIDNPRPRYENLLEPLNFFPEIEPDRVRIAPDRSTADGVELLVRGRAGDRLAWWLSYAYARSEDRIGGETVPRSLDQPHTVALALDVQLPRSWALALAWRYHTGWPTTPVTALPVPPGPPDEEPEEPEEPGEPEGPGLVAVFGPLNSERLPDYHRLDLRVSREWPLRYGRLTLYLDVQNLYDRENLAGFDLAVDDEAGTLVPEEEHWPGLFPSIGVIWSR